MDRRKTKDVLFHAFQCAIQDRETFADAYGWTGPEAEEAKKDIKAFRRLCKRFCDTDRTELRKMIDEAETVSIFDLLEGRKKIPN